MKTQAWIAVALLCLLPPLAVAAVLQGNPSDYRSQLDQLQPGDTLELASGTYTTGLPVSGINGTANAWITVRGPADGSAIFTARSCCNTIEINDTSYLEISQLTLDGQGMDGPFGVNSSGPSHHITLSKLIVRDHDGSQQTVGISTKAPAWNWIVRDCLIQRAGTGIYFGNSDGTQPFVAGLIENNVMLDTIGYNMEIKHQVPRPTNIGLPTGQSRTIIRNNVFSKNAANSSGGGLARPNLLVGHFPLSGAGQDDVYEIYGNFFYQNPTEALFQGEGNLAIYANLFVNDYGDAINIQAHHDQPRAVDVFQNTVVATDGGIRISGANTAYEQRVRGNASFAGNPLSGGTASGNVTDSYAAAGNYLNAPFAAIGQLDLFPLAGQLTGTPIDTTGLSAYTQWNLDFNGNARDHGIRGAYSGAGQNPGWQLALDFKGQSVAPPPPAPTVSLSASPTTVPAGGTADLSWSASAGSSCTASGGWNGSRPVSGTETVGPLSASTTFLLSCANAGGQSTASQLITVTAGAPSPTVSLMSADGAVNPGDSTVLTWSSTNATDCMASGGWSGAKALAGSEQTPPLNANTGFSLRCTGSGGEASRTVTVAVNSPPPNAQGNGGGGSGGSAAGPGSLLLLLVTLSGALQRRNPTVNT